MAKPCEAEGRQRGVVVQTWSGTRNNKVICDLRNHFDVRHCVRVENLRLYPAKVECKGDITTDANILEFYSSNFKSYTATSWQASIKALGMGLPYTFSPCVLRPVGAANGTEIIVTEVVIEWYQPGKKQSVSLNIAVSA